MLSKCANPACSTPFRYLRDGKLFEIASNGSSGPTIVGERKAVRKVEFFWLCGQCSTELMVVYDQEKGIVTVPLDAPHYVRRAAAS